MRVGLAAAVTGVAMGCALVAMAVLPASVVGQAASCAGVYGEKVQQIFDTNCVVCHQDAQPLGNLSLQRNSAVKNLVRVMSDEVPGMARVMPGNATQSYLIHKLRGTHLMVGGSGERMPFGGQPLAEGDIATIQAWIMDCMAAA